MSVSVSVSVDVNTPDITPPFPLVKVNFSKEQSVISVSALLSEISDALIPTDSITGVVTWGVTVTVFMITLQSDVAVMSVYPRVEGAMNVIFMNDTWIPLQVKREPVMPEAERGMVTALVPEGMIEIVPEEKEVDADSAVCVPSAS